MPTGRIFWDPRFSVYERARTSSKSTAATVSKGENAHEPILLGFARLLRGANLPFGWIYPWATTTARSFSGIALICTNGPSMRLN